MQYLDLIHKFWKINAESDLNSSAVVLYLYLLEEWHCKGEKDFELSDVEISNVLKLSRLTIRQSKGALRNLGLINYQVKNGYPTYYKIITDYSINRKAQEKTSPSPSQTNLVFEEKKDENLSESVSVPAPAAEKRNKPLSSESKTQLSQSVEDNSKYPSFQEFLEYAKTLEGYSSDLDLALKNKYETWQENSWVNGYGRPISNWKQTLKNSIPYLKKSSNDIFQIPNIKRPKSTYNE